jgi:hypothetical protein
VCKISNPYIYQRARLPRLPTVPLVYSVHARTDLCARAWAVDTVGIETARLHKTLLHSAFLDYTSQNEVTDRTKPGVLTRISNPGLDPGCHAPFLNFFLQFTVGGSSTI